MSARDPSPDQHWSDPAWQTENLCQSHDNNVNQSVLGNGKVENVRTRPHVYTLTTDFLFSERRYRAVDSDETLECNLVAEAGVKMLDYLCRGKAGGRAIGCHRIQWLSDWLLLEIGYDIDTCVEWHSLRLSASAVALVPSSNSRVISSSSISTTYERSRF